MRRYKTLMSTFTKRIDDKTNNNNNNNNSIDNNNNNNDNKTKKTKNIKQKDPIKESR